VPIFVVYLIAAADAVYAFTKAMIVATILQGFAAAAGGLLPTRDKNWGVSGASRRREALKESRSVER